MSLSKRLLSLASLVPEGAYIADVGSDHCALPIYLFGQKRIRGALAIENKKGPYGRMEEAIRLSGYPIEASLSDGISYLNSEVDTLLIAGMGGALISRILLSEREKLSKIKAIVLDPHSERPLLRKVLFSLGYEEKEGISLYDDGKYYELSRYEKSDKPLSLSEDELLFGSYNLKHPSEDFITHLKQENVEIERILPLIKDKGRSETLRREKALRERILHENSISHS